jgi:CubicO group peptidase (beta-lactamase class C family)
MHTLDFAKHFLFEPLGIKDFTWDVDAQNIATGGWGIHMTTRDMAKIGLLFLHHGEWDGQRVVSEDWVKNATTPHIEQPDLDYGYQWWIYPSHGAYLAEGRGGQTIFVDPEDDLVIAATGDMHGHALIFNLIEQFVFPSITR